MQRTLDLIRTNFGMLGGSALAAHLIGMSAVVALMTGLSPAVAKAEEVLKVRYSQDSVESYTMEELRALPGVLVETATPWTDGPQRFVGIALHALLGEVSPAAVLSLRAVNDYAVDIPVSDVTPDYPVVAYERNGKNMSVRDKGPLWLVYPFDTHDDFQTETVYSRSIWQLVEITVGE